MDSDQNPLERQVDASSGHISNCTPHYTVPQWFLENIQTADELVDKDVKIWLNNENPSGIKDSTMTTQPISEYPLSKSTTDEHSHCFHIGQNNFELLLDIVASLQKPDRIGRLSPSRSSLELCSNMRFGLGFLDELVLLIARELNSSLVSINSQDLEDLGLEFYYQDLHIQKSRYEEMNDDDGCPYSNVCDSSTAQKAEVEDDDNYDTSTIAKKASRCYFGGCDDLHATRQDDKRASEAFLAIINAIKSKNRRPEAVVVSQDMIKSSCSDASARPSRIILYFRDGLKSLAPTCQYPQVDDSPCMNVPIAGNSRGHSIQDMVRRYRKRGENIAMIFATTHTDLDEGQLEPDSQTQWKVSRCDCRICSNDRSSRWVDSKPDKFTVLPLSVPISWTSERESRSRGSVTAIRIQSFKRRLKAELWQLPSNPAKLLEPSCDWFSLLPKPVTDRFASLSFTTDVMTAFNLITSRCFRKGIVDLNDLRAIFVQINGNSVLDAAKEDGSIESNILEENEVEEDDLVKGYDYLDQLFSPTRPEKDEKEDEEEEDEEEEDEEEEDEEEEDEEEEDDEEEGEERKDAEVDHPAYVVQSADKLNADFDVTFFDRAALARIKTLIQLWKAENQAALSSFAAQAKSRSILLYGAPGTGKTLLVQAVATTKEFKVINVNNRTIRSADDNIAKDYIRAIFSSAQRNQPCIILIDDVEIIFKSTLSSWEYEVAKDFMDCLDALKREGSSSFVLATTNEPWVVNTNFSRRMHQVPMQLPDAQTRVHIIGSCLGKENLASIDLEHLTTATEAFSIAELQDLCNQTTLVWDSARNQAPGQERPEIATSLMDEHFAEALKNVQSNATAERLDALEKYSRKQGTMTSNTTQNDAWEEFVPRVQKVMRWIDSKEPGESDQPFFWEKQFLSLVVKPKDMQTSWSDLAVDLKTEQVIKQLIKYHQDGGTSTESYGLLRGVNTIGGALLYGPPGTGKTQLARALAHDCDMVAICATSADLQGKWHGDGPKAIKALFNLGKLLAPSIVFIDEAESLFLKRENLNYQHLMAELNQFLHEMDGLSSSQKSPFVLLATNLPGRLDSAVLRRVPNMFYFGLPTFTLRQRIFEILLRDEIIDSALSTHDLAAETSRFTGSDIKSLCMRVALSCDEFVEEDGKDKGKRLLTTRMFQETLKLLQPTATKAAISSIKAFAKEHDPHGIAQMQEFEVEEFRVKTLPEMAKAAGLSEDPDVKTPPVLAEAASLGEADVQTETSLELENELDDSHHALELPLTPCIVSQQDTTQVTLMSTASSSSNMAHTPHAKIAVPAALYDPLPERGNKIRVLSITPRERQINGSYISCTLHHVDLQDWTAKYQSFLAMLPIFGEDLRLIQGRVLHILWINYNKSPDIVRRIVETGLRFFAENISLDGYCDEPLESLKTLHDRYTWGDYIALSYVWGDQTTKKKILLNDKPFEVGLNLHDALERLSTSYEVQSRGLKIWIDAICINQGDLDERQAEVKRMDLIYSRAIAVRGWLGNPSDEVAAELPEFRSTLDTVFGIFEAEPNESELQIMDLRTRQKALDDAMGLLQLEYHDEDRMFAIWSVIDGISAAPYWKRVWVTQEIALGSSIIFWYGNSYVTAKELTALQDWAKEQEPLQKLHAHIRLEILLKTVCNLKFVIHVLFWTRVNVAGSLLEIERQDDLLIKCITHATYCEATDPRDKVYGLLALLPPAMSSLIRPNYSSSSSWRSTWSEFTKVYFQHQGNLNLLARIRRTTLDFRNDMPSWALNLQHGETEVRYSMAHLDSSSLKESKEILTIHETAQIIFNAENQKSIGSCSGDAGLQPSYTFSKDGQLLSCMGIFVDQVSHMSIFEYLGPSHNTAVMRPNTSYRRQCPDPRLSLCRAMMGNRKFQWEDGPSIFDVPWFSAEELQDMPTTPRAVRLGSHVRLIDDGFGVVNLKYSLNGTEWANNIPWTQKLSDEECLLRSMFSEHFHPNADLPLRGTPLREYFTSKQVVCKDSALMDDLVEKSSRLLHLNRIFETRDGLVGWVTDFAQPGDSIAIIFGCDMPVVLRPKAGEYEVIGSCFLDGLMNGEVKEEIESGTLVPETITLC